MRRLALVSLASLASLTALAVARADDQKKPTYETPKEWKEQPAKSGGFAPTHEWKLEKAEGDEDEPTVKVYHFGGQGGTLDDNVKRWASQFKTADGEAFPVEKAKKETFESNGLKITVVEIAGTYKPPAMMGGGEAKKNQKLLAAYVDGPGGPWFVKLQGPEKSVEKARDAYVKWLKSWKVAEKG